MQRLPERGAGRLFAELAERNREAPALEDAGGAEHDIVPQRVAYRFGMADVLHAFVERHASPQAEDQHRHDQAPEVQLFAMAEGMLRRSRPVAELESDEQQDAVERIDGGVDPFGQHRRTACDAGDDELGDGDRDVGRDRTVDRNSGLGHEDRIASGPRSAAAGYPAGFQPGVDATRSTSAPRCPECVQQFGCSRPTGNGASDSDGLAKLHRTTRACAARRQLTQWQARRFRAS